MFVAQTLIFSLLSVFKKNWVYELYASHPPSGHVESEESMWLVLPRIYFDIQKQILEKTSLM
jgi:hypothetical protein